MKAQSEQPGPRAQPELMEQPGPRAQPGQLEQPGPQDLLEPPDLQG